jgi:hypothetical protein
MLRVEIKAKDDPANTLNLFDSLIKDIQVTDEKLKKQLDEIGPETAQKMIETIQNNKVRPQADEPNELESHINCEMFEGGWGVGDIQELNDEVGYWAAINWGSAHMVGRRVPNGYFSPGLPNPTPDAFRQGRWKPGETETGAMAGGNTGFPGTGKGHWSFIVTNPIPPMNYIEQTADWLDSRLDKLTPK